MRTLLYRIIGLVGILAVLIGACASTQAAEPPKSIGLLSSEAALHPGERALILYRVWPENASWRVTYRSANPSVAAVDDNGLVTAIDYGTTAIYVTAESANRVYAIYTVSVVDPWVPQRIVMNAAALTVEPTESAIVTARVEPETANHDVVWTSTAPSVASVSPEGVVTALAEGKATITACSAAYPSVASSVNLTVAYAPAPQSIAVEGPLALLIGQRAPIAFSVEPEGASDVVGYRSAHPSIASVSPEGIVTGLAQGETTITVYSQRKNRIQAALTVRVLDPEWPAQVTVDIASARLDPGDTQALCATVEPSTAPSDVQWTSSSEAIATVDARGVVMAHASGIATITATSVHNAEALDTCTVTVTSDTRALIMPERRTGIEEIPENLDKIDRVKASALLELEEWYTQGAIDEAERNSRRNVIESAFSMYSFAWMTPEVRRYWSEANSENGAKHFVPGVVYYGMPYISGNNSCRCYTHARAVAEEYYLPTDEGYYLMNPALQMYGKYVGSDCSSFVSMAIFGLNNPTYSFAKTDFIFTESYYYNTLDKRDPAVCVALRPGDILVKYGSHVIMFLYYADAAKTQFVAIEQGGSEPGINTVSTSVYTLADYLEDGYRIRRLRRYALK